MTPAYSFEIDLGLVAVGLRIDRRDAVAAFGDGRVASRFAEIWAEKLFGLTRHPRDHRSSDGFYRLADGDTAEIAVRTLTKRGIKFQDSAFIGARRTCSLADLRASIRRSDRWLVFDIRAVPTVTVYKVRCAVLEHWIDRQDLTASGLSAGRFCDLLNRDAKPMVRQLELVLP